MFHPIFKGGSLLAALLVSTAAHADLTADQVWANWQQMYGPTLTAGSETREGTTLVIGDLAVVLPLGDGSVSFKIERVNFRELGDGTVEMTMSPEYPFVVNLTDPDDKQSVVNLLVRQPDLKMIAAGTEAEIRYDITAPSAKVLVIDAAYDGKPVDIKGEIDFTALGGNYIVTAGAPPRFASSLAAESAGVSFAMTDPETGGTMSLKGTVNTLAETSTGSLGDMGLIGTGSLTEALKASVVSDVGFTYGATSIDFSTTDGADTLKGTTKLGSGNITFALDTDRLAYGGGARDVAISIASSDVPVPLELSYGEAAFKFQMPTTKSDVPGDFAVLTRLIDLQLSDNVWGLFDPQKVLPRDPATLVIDLKGKMNWLAEIMDPAQAETFGADGPPAELHALDVTELRLRAAGAEASGTGAFTFDNSDTTTFEGVPLPTGKLDLSIVGANGLLDRLVQMGTLPADQAGAARMMMGLFARTVEGADDTLTSTLEFKDKGFFANGQRLQ